MRFYKGVVVVFMLGMLVFGAFPAYSEGDSDIKVEVLIDFGNGIVEWAEVTLTTNRTAIKATEEACEQLSLNLVAAWSQWGVFVYEIGGKASPPDWSWWWSIVIWNETTDSWDASLVGASALFLNEGDVIGWCPGPSKPTSTPNARYPWVGFQHDALNSGYAKSSAPTVGEPSWVYYTGTMEMPSSPAIAYGKVIVNNWGGVYCLDEKGELLWKNPDVIGGFSPAISDEKVFVGGKDGYLYSLNLANGTMAWKIEITSDPGVSGVTSPPAVMNSRIFIGGYNYSGGEGYLYCLDKDTGAVIWKNTTHSSVYFSSPGVTEDRVYIGTMGLYVSSTLQWDPPYGLYCFDAGNGDLLWNFSADGSVGSSPTIVDNMVLFTSRDGYLYSLNTANGHLNWKKNIGYSTSSPAVCQGKIFVGSGMMGSDGKFYSYDVNGNKLWEFEPNGAVQSSPAIAEDKVYFATNVQNGTIYCLNLNTHELVWRYTPSPKQYIISSPAITDGRLFICSDNGRLYCFADGPPRITLNATGTTHFMDVGEGIRFVHKDEEHRVFLKGITADSVILEIDSSAQTVDIELDQEKSLDINGNGKNELMIKVNSIDVTAQTASLTLKTIPESKNEEIPMIFVIVMMLIVIVILAGVLFALKRR